MVTRKQICMGAKYAPCVATLVALAVFAVGTAQVKAGPAELQNRPPQTFVPEGISEELQGIGGRVRIYVLLRSQPVLEAAQASGRQSVISGRIAGTARARKAARAHPRHQSGSELRFARQAEARRQHVLRVIGQAGEDSWADQEPVAAAINRAGGSVIERNPAPNSVIARAPAAALAELAAMPQVQAIEPAPEPKPLLDVSAPAMGAPTWWDAGYTGGRGNSDTSGADIAILESGINESNPAFAGVEFQDPANFNCNSAYVHGTAVAGVVASQDAEKRGLAYGADTVLNACWGGGGSAWALGVDQHGCPGAGDPAEVLNASYGRDPDQDDDVGAQEADYEANLFGVSYVAAAGNSGPSATTVFSPSTAYNAISVGSINDMGTVERSDDIMVSSSSRGATVTGRKKPDLVAMGGSGGGRGLNLPNGAWQKEGDPVFREPMSGTSFAAPHVAAGALLLAGAGVVDSMARKAILINSAYPFAGQIDWRADSGWGVLDLDRAFAERGNYALGSVPARGARFYAATADSADRATLTWQRRVFSPYFPGCCQQVAYALTDLNLDQYDRSTEALKGTSDSAIDSVEQVRSPAGGEVIYKVKAASSTIGAADSEPYALASTKSLTALDPPNLEQSPSVSPSQAQPGDEAVLEVPVKNSGNLPEHAAEVTLDPPPGVEIVAGDKTQAVGDGTLDPGEAAAAKWTVRGDHDGTYTLPVTATATGFGETFQSESKSQLKIDSAPPNAQAAALPAYSPSNEVPLSWSGSDGQGAGVRSYDVQYRKEDGPWADLLTDTTATSAGFTGQDGHTYGFRVRASDALDNIGAFAELPQAQTTVDTEPPELSVSVPVSTALGNDVPVSVNASDATSGIATQTWQLDGSAPVEFAGDGFAVLATLLGSGTDHTLAINVTDRAGHSTQRQVSLSLERAVAGSSNEGKRAPQLRVRPIVTLGNSIYVLGSVARGATGTVRVKALRASNTLSRTLALRARQWSVRLTVSHRGRYRLRVTYSGDRRFMPAATTSRLVKVG